MRYTHTHTDRETERQRDRERERDGSGTARCWVAKALSGLRGGVPAPRPGRRGSNTNDVYVTDKQRLRGSLAVAGLGQ